MQLEPKTRAVIIDRTLPSFYPTDHMKGSDILDFCRLLDLAGVDLIEVNSPILKKMGKIPEGLDFVLEAETTQELEEFCGSGIERIVLKPAMLSLREVSEFILLKNIYVILEMNADDFTEPPQLTGIGRMPGISVVNCIRLTGLGRTPSHFWFEKAEHIRTITGKSLDICPEYSMSMGNALLQEAAISGMDFVTSAFAGYGREGRFASTEVLLTFLKVMHAGSGGSHLEILPELKALFEKLTCKSIPHNFPVIGKNIFRVESGIHVGGINMTPKTYEPYEPEMVGLQREIVIGKHSGRQSVIAKLTELGMDADAVELQVVLDKVRELSVKMNRSLCDDEFVDVCSGNF